MADQAQNAEDVFDVIVIGYGFAGAAAALTAHDHGARVLLLEKRDTPGGNSRISGGHCVVAGESARDRELFADYVEGLCLGRTPRDVIDAFASGTTELVGFFGDLGGKLGVSAYTANPVITYPGVTARASHSGVMAADGSFDKYCIAGEPAVPPAMRMWELLVRGVAARGITAVVNAPATALHRDSSRAVTGVSAAIGGEARRFHARRGVVLACGGFENNKALTQAYLRVRPVAFAGSPGNTGDGVALAQSVGADLWHMDSAACMVGYQSTEFGAAFGIYFPAPGFIYVDQDARRFADETTVELHSFDVLLGETDTSSRLRRVPMWGVFNDDARRAGPLCWNRTGENRDLYTWSPDNSRELERGWILQAASPADLAGQMGISAAGLSATVERYNGFCADGADGDYARDAATLQPLTPPFYAIKLRPTLLNTQGGARRDARARVLGGDGAPVGRLYSAGEFGSLWGGLYQGAGNVAECLVFGRIAGQNAAREPARE